MGTALPAADGGADRDARRAAAAPAGLAPRPTLPVPRRGDPAALKLDVAVVAHSTGGYLLNLLESIRDRLDPRVLGEVHVWDNASSDRTLDLLARFSSEVPWLRVHASAANVHHGPALGLLLRHHVRGEWVLLLDADAELTADPTAALAPLLASRPGFVGQVHPEPDGFYLYLCHLLLHRPTYLTLPPFVRHGAPGVDLFREAAERAVPWARFRWVDHVRHFGQAALRGVAARGERANELHRFAAAQRDACRERLELEARLERRMAAYVSGAALPERPPSSSAPGWPFPDAAIPAARRRSPLSRLAALLPRAVADAARRRGAGGTRAELPGLFSLLRSRRPRTVLAIGTGWGGFLLLLSRAAAPGARLVSVGLPPWEADDPLADAAVERLRSFVPPSRSVVLLRSAPAEDAAVAAAREALGRERADVLLVDEEASGAAAARLLPLYRPLALPGATAAVLDRRGRLAVS